MTSPKNSVQNQHLVESLAFLIRETFEGSPEGQPSAYLDRGVGMFNTIESLSAEQASRNVVGTTIAAHTEHAKFYLDRVCEFMHGRTERVNWEDSWLIETVNDQEWEALRGTVRKAYENTLKSIAEVNDWDLQKTGMAIGLIAHTAYHLGAMRQIAKSAK